MFVAIKTGIKDYRYNTGTESKQEGVRFKQGTLKEIEKMTQKKVTEWGIDLLTRSTEKIRTTPELLKDKEADKTILLMNLTAHSAIREILHARQGKRTNSNQWHSKSKRG